MEVEAKSVDASHFDPNYFSGNSRWHLPDLAGSEFFYDLAGRYFASNNGRIVNATVGGKLELFQRLELEEWLEQ